jgi:hypothetical protein
MQMTPRFTVLQAIFSMSSEHLPITRGALAERVWLSGRALDAHLAALDRHGFIDSKRLRLTLSGLAVAVAMRSSSAPDARVAHVAA